MRFLNRLLYKNRKFYDDDFDWDNYTNDSYERRLKSDIESTFSTVVNPDDAQVDRRAGNVVLKGRPLHPNHQLILDAILQLSPQSVHEIGCGGGDHVENARRLFPEIKVTGGDRSAMQLSLARQRHPGLRGRGSLGIQDITMPHSAHWPVADLVYSQAVVMHIHTAVSHLVALANMTRIARRYILLVENFQCHNFVRDVSTLHQGGHLEWDRLHIYRFDGSTGGKAILLSPETLAYPMITHDDEIREDDKPSRRRLKRADEDSERGLFGFVTTD